MRLIQPWPSTKTLPEQARYRLLKNLFNVSIAINALLITTTFPITLNIIMDSIEDVTFLIVMWAANPFKNLYSIMSGRVHTVVEFYAQEHTYAET